MKTHSLRLQPGSAVAISLLYIAIILMMILGVTSLLAKIMRSNGYIAQGIQAGYNAESGIELALYELKLRREGYEHTRNYFPKTDAFDTPLPNSKTAFHIQYKGKATGNSTDLYNGSLLTGKKQLALYYDERTDSGDFKIISLHNDTPISLDLKAPPGTPSPCLIAKISGQRVDNEKFEAVSTTIDCDQTVLLQSLVGKDTTDTTKDNTGILPFSTFMQNHKENVLELKSIYKTEPGITFTLSSPSQDFATIQKEVIAGGRFNNIEVRKKVILEQDQTPEILSSVILHN